MKVSLKIDASDMSGNDVKTTVSYIKPTATDNQIVTLAQAINAITSNTYVKVHRIEDKEIIGE